MKLYRFSPIGSEPELLRAIRYIHRAGHTLCREKTGKFLPVRGFIGVFCHYDREYAYLTRLCEAMTIRAGNFNNKYFLLKNPITIRKTQGIPQAVYTHLYIRKPDPYRAQVGDLDFFMEKNPYSELKRDIENRKAPGGVRMLPDHPGHELIELYHPDIDACAYIQLHEPI